MDFNGKGISLNPNFSDLEPAVFLSHIEELRKGKEAKPYKEIFNELLEQVKPSDFEALALQKAGNTLKQLGQVKLTNNYYSVLAIDYIRELAIKNNWGLFKKYDSIYLFNGCYWVEIDREEFQNFLGRAAEKMGIVELLSRSFHFRELLFKQFLSISYLESPETSKDKVLINLKNGTFEITPSGTRFRPFDRSDFLTYQLPFDYEPRAKAPIFEAYLNRVLPDVERQKVLAEFLGYVFIKHESKFLKEEKALILYGTGANGKSVFFEVVNALLGSENVSNYSLQSLTGESDYYRAKISNKLVNYASEINGKLESSFFKQLVSGEPIQARLPYGEPFALKDYAKLIFNCNELPKDVEHTEAYFRRFLIIPFDVKIPESEQDKNLHNKIIENELSGVFNWVLDGLNRLLSNKRFSECEAVRQALENYKLESDTVRLFLNDNDYRKSITNEKPLKDLFNEYKNYCLEGGFKSCSVRTFSDRLRNLGFHIQRKNFGMVINIEKISV